MDPSELHELTRSVISNPDDDGPRLAFAREVESYNPARAVFIRWQCALGRHPHANDAYAYDVRQLVRNAIAPPPRGVASSADYGAKALRHGLSIQCAELEDDWVPNVVRDAAYACTFRRGFAEGVYIDTTSLLANAERLFEAAPLTHLTLEAPRDWSPTESPRAVFEEILALPQVSSLKSLALGPSFDDACALALAQCARLDGLTHLSFGQSKRLTKTGVEALSSSPYLTRLSSLELSRAKVGAAGVEALVAGPLASRLRHLWLADCRAGGKALVALAKAPLPALAHLDIGGNALSKASLKQLPKAEWASQLESLSLRGNALRGGMLGAIAGGPFLSLRKLDLGFAQVAEGELESLAGADIWTGLEELDLEFNGIGDQDVAAVFGEEFGAVLRYANLSQCNRLTSKSLSFIASSSRASELARLFISGCGEDCADAIVGSAYLSNLRSLHMGGRKWRDSTVEAVLASPGMRGLQHLDAPGTRVSRRDTVDAHAFAERMGVNFGDGVGV